MGVQKRTEVRLLMVIFSVSVGVKCSDIEEKLTQLIELAIHIDKSDEMEIHIAFLHLLQKCKFKCTGC